MNETACIPKLICKVTACLNLFIRETHIVSWAVTVCKSKAKCVCTVLVDDFQRVDAVAQRLRHLSALCITNKSMNKNCIKRSFSCLLNAREHHTHNPERNNIIACYKCACRIVMLEILSFFRPAKG